MSIKTIERIQKMLVEVLYLDKNPNELEPEVPIFHTGLGLDSIDALEIVVALEREFNIMIEDHEMGSELFTNLKSMAQYVEYKLNNQESGNLFWDI